MISPRQGWTALPLALTMGEPAGIGVEIALRAWQRRGSGVPPFVVVGDPALFRERAEQLGLDTAVTVVATAEAAAAAFPTALPVLAEPLPGEVQAGRPDPANGACVRRCIERAVALAMDGRVGGVVTNPIHKHVMHQAGFAFPGHTEFLGHLGGGADRPVMMLACPSLRVVPVTIHVRLLDAIGGLSTARIVDTCRVLDAALQRDFALTAPRIALSGLNPHAGEGGEFGDEERTVIEPAIDILRRDGMRVSGPHPADTMFSERSRAGFDVAVCMYHDQALIPIKALDFDHTVNVTLGLPFVRTSPDHGTAFDIAGTGKASEESLVSALRLAADMAQARASRACAG